MKTKTNRLLATLCLFLAVEAAASPEKFSDKFTVQETQDDSVKIREFLTPEGTIFGIAWNGIAPPDLDSLLGAHAEEFHAAAKEAPRAPGQRHHEVKAENVVVEQWGHMRNIQGRAYLPALLPQGVSANEIH